MVIWKLLENLLKKIGGVYISSKNIAVLTGNITIEPEMGKVVAELDYPEGFTKDNCVLISFGSRYHTNYGYAFGYHSKDSAGFLFGTNDRDVFLEDKIKVWYYNIADSEKTFYYKIVLLKYE